MALPLPKPLSDNGGPLLNALNSINDYANRSHQRRINKVKADYAPMTTQAEAASKLAYANLMGPQFMAKLMTNPGFLGNTDDNKLQQIRELITKAGTGQGTGNALMGMPNYSGTGQPSTNNFSGWVQNAVKGLVDRINPSQNEYNPFSQTGQAPQPQQQMTQTNRGPQYDMPLPGQEMAQPSGRPKDGVTVEGEQWYNDKGEPVYAEEVQEPDGTKMELELTKDIPYKTYAQNTGKYQGTVKQLEQEGKYRADALKSIGESQLGLSNSGAVLDRMTGIVTNPIFSNMRNKIPGFQNKQLDYLKVMGTPEEKELIGDFLSTGESFIASTVQGFSGKPLVREFDLAQRQKITGHDTVESAIGKLRSARTLHDIAEQKNQIVSELLQKGYNVSDAVKKANKMVDVSAIEKSTNDQLQRKIEIKNSKTGEKKMVTIDEARKLGVPNV